MGSGDMDSRDQHGLGALCLYLTLSILFFARGLVGHFFTAHIGQGPDQSMMAWFLVWWPYAIAHGLNPVMPHVYWAPFGYNLTWSTSIPLISILATPLTAMIGPVAALNVLCILFLPVAAWCAFILCRYISGNYWSAIVGGYVFGFSPFMLGKLLFAHLQFVSLFPVPLIVYLALRRLRGELSARRFVSILALLIVVQFLCSAEVFLTMTMFGAMALGLAWVSNPGYIRRGLQEVMAGAICSYGIALLVLTPYLYYFFLGYHPYSGPMWSDDALGGSADALNFLIPGPTNELGRIPWFDWVSEPFNRGNASETLYYLAWPLIIIAGLFAWRHWREPLHRLLVDWLAIILVLSLGRVLVVRGHITSAVLPWWIFDQVPAWLLHTSVLQNLAPSRFSIYAYLILAVMTALWLSTTEVKSWLRVMAAAAVVVCMLPNLSAAYWVYPTPIPAFVSTGLYRDYLKRGETVLILPFWPDNKSMLWQAETRMYFNMAQGPGPWPINIRNWPILNAFSEQTYLPDAAEQMRAYLVDRGVNTIIVDDSALPTWQRLMSTLGVPQTKIGGVTLYKLPLRPEKEPALTLTTMRTQFDRERFATVLIRLDQFLSHGGKMDDLLAVNAPELGLIPADSLIGPAQYWDELRVPVNERLKEMQYGIGLLTWNGSVVVGETAWDPIAKELVERYGATASQVFFVRGNRMDLSNEWQVVNSPYRTDLMFMVFTPEQLAKAAAIARRTEGDSAAPVKIGAARPSVSGNH
jgi:hypothetical protein